jgi:hypothetical protein
LRKEKRNTACAFAAKRCGFRRFPARRANCASIPPPRRPHAGSGGGIRVLAEQSREADSEAAVLYYQSLLDLEPDDIEARRAWRN